MHDYSNNNRNVHSRTVIEQFWNDHILLRGAIPRQNNERPTVHRNQLRWKQVIAFDIISHLIECNNLPIQYERGFILTGEAGCGKSFVINALCSKFGNSIKLMAPSGKASANIGGETIHRRSLKIGVKRGFSSGKSPLQGKQLSDLQQEFKDINTIICDEYTMISCKLFNQMNQRCQQAKNNMTKPFGGMTVILVGDPGQLPPVSGKPLWTHLKPSDMDELGGQGLYLKHYFHFAIKLEGSNRLDPSSCPHKPFFEKFLADLRNGTVDYPQFEEFNALISEEEHKRRFHGSAEEFQKAFMGHESTWYFNTNDDILKHNLKMLSMVNSPICRIDAKHNQTKKLQPTFYVSVNSKIVLNWNMSTQYKLCNNGTTGTVKDIFLQREKIHQPTFL